MKYKLKTFKHIQGRIQVITGLYIGSGGGGMEIGGVDMPIIRNPVTKEPYIPGSSLKGKLRSLMEWSEDGTLDSNGRVHKCSTIEEALGCPICRVFGISADDKFKIGPTRLIVRDAFLTPESSKRFREGSVIEDKAENNINRITAKATPRFLERVVPGVEFVLDISFKVLDFENDGGKTDEDNFTKVVLKALATLEQDFLGGGGSRGNGKIKFIDLIDEDNKPITLPKVKV